MSRNFFHLHLVSDSTGETLIAVSRAAAAQYQGISAIEHVYPLVRSEAQLARVLAEIEASPGVVLYTLVEPEWSQRLENFCRELGCPCLSVLNPVLALFQSYLGQASAPKPGAQHVLNAEYFRRIDAMNYTLLHDDGQLGGDLVEHGTVYGIVFHF
jgi:regulator of PEP synthase PpsR (kinase-PPPase family)